MFFKQLVVKDKYKVKFDLIPKTNEDYISLTNGCMGFSEIYRFSSMGLDEIG